MIWLENLRIRQKVRSALNPNRKHLRMKGAIPEAEAAPLKYFSLRWAHYIDLVLEGKILAKGFG
jgi:hypothetical protein